MDGSETSPRPRDVDPIDMDIESPRDSRLIRGRGGERDLVLMCVYI